MRMPSQKKTGNASERKNNSQKMEDASYENNRLSKTNQAPKKDPSL